MELWTKNFLIDLLNFMLTTVCTINMAMAFSLALRNAFQKLYLIVHTSHCYKMIVAATPGWLQNIIYHHHLYTLTCSFQLWVSVLFQMTINCDQPVASKLFVLMKTVLNEIKFLLMEFHNFTWENLTEQSRAKQMTSHQNFVAKLRTCLARQISYT